MVVKYPGRVRGAATFFVTLALAVFPSQGTFAESSGDSHPALMPRFAISPPAQLSDPGLQIVVDAAMQTVMDDERALWFELPIDRASGGRDPDDDFITTLTDTAWTRHQAEVLVVLDAWSSDAGDQALGRGSIVQVQARIYRVRPPGGDGSSGLGFWETEVAIDVAGRYLRPAVWQSLAAAIMAHVEIARPIVELEVISNGPVELTGLPEWADVRRVEDGRVLVRLRSLREYRFTVSRADHRPQDISLYVERTPVSLRVDLNPYPRHTVAATLRGLAWPGLEYGWYPPSTRWTARVGVTSFLLGLTPLRQTADVNAEPRIISSYELTEIEIGWHGLLNDRDRPHRMSIGAGGVVRLVHGSPSFGLDPAIPWAVRPVLGWEWELSRRLTLSQTVATDLFISPRPAFVPGEVWVRRMGPVFWQLPVYRAGVRVRL